LKIIQEYMADGNYPWAKLYFSAAAAPVAAKGWLKKNTNNSMNEEKG